MYVAYVRSKRKENMVNRYCSDNDHEQLRLFLFRPVSLDFADSQPVHLRFGLPKSLLPLG